MSTLGLWVRILFVACRCCFGWRPSVPGVAVVVCRHDHVKTSVDISRKKNQRTRFSFNLNVLKLRFFSKDVFSLETKNRHRQNSRDIKTKTKLNFYSIKTFTP